MPQPTKKRDVFKPSGMATVPYSMIGYWCIGIAMYIYCSSSYAVLIYIIIPSRNKRNLIENGMINIPTANDPVTIYDEYDAHLMDVLGIWWRYDGYMVDIWLIYGEYMVNM